MQSNILELVKYSTKLVQQYERKVALLEFTLSQKEARILELESLLYQPESEASPLPQISDTSTEIDEELPEWKSDWFYEVWGGSQPSQLKSYLKGLNEGDDEDKIYHWITHNNKGELNFGNQQLAKIFILKKLENFYIPKLNQEVLDLFEELMEKKKNNECMTSKSREQTDSEYSKWDAQFGELRSQTVAPYALFGGWLPPRRLEDIKILHITADKKDFDNYPNQYVKNENTFYFNKYKNSDRKKCEKFTLDQNTFEYLELDVIQKIKKFLNQLPEGNLFGDDLNYPKFRRSYINLSGFSCNAWRHYWETKINIYDGSPTKKAKLQRWLSHNAAVAQANYIADPNNITINTPSPVG